MNYVSSLFWFYVNESFVLFFLKKLTSKGVSWTINWEALLYLVVEKKRTTQFVGNKVNETIEDVRPWEAMRGSKDTNRNEKETELLAQLFTLTSMTRRLGVGGFIHKKRKTSSWGGEHYWLSNPGTPTLEFWVRKSLLDLRQDMQSMMNSSGLRLLSVVRFVSVSLA